MNKTVLIVALLAVSLAACDNHAYTQPQPQVVYQQPAPTVVAAPVAAAPAPVIINQAAPSQGDHLVAGALMGGALGYMAGRSNSQPTYVDRRPVVVNKTVVVKQYNAPKTVNVVSRSSFTPTPSPSRLSLSKPSSPSRSFGGFSRRR